LGSDDGSIPHSEEFDKIFKKELDLDNSVLSVVKGEELFLFKSRVYNDGRRMDYFLLYKYALGISDVRKGTFYGAAACLVDQRVDVKTMIEALRGLAGVVEKCCIENDGFVHGLLAAESGLDELKESVSIKAVLRTVKPLAGTEKKPKTSTAKPEFVFVEDPQRLEEFAAYKHSERLGNSGPDVYFSSSPAIKEQAERSYKENKLTVATYPPPPSIKSAPEDSSIIAQPNKFWEGHSQSVRKSKWRVSPDRKQPGFLDFWNEWKVPFAGGLQVVQFIVVIVMFLVLLNVYQKINNTDEKLDNVLAATGKSTPDRQGLPIAQKHEDRVGAAGGDGGHDASRGAVPIASPPRRDLPGAADEPDAPGGLTCSPDSSTGTYVVKPGDTLDGLASAKCYNGKCTPNERALYVQKVKQMNGLDSNNLRMDQKLKLPICANH